MITKNLQRAMDLLHIEDVYIRSSQAQCVKDFDPKYGLDSPELRVQQMHLVKGYSVIELDESSSILKAEIALGVRWVEISDGQEPDIKAFIEADYIAEYKMNEHIPVECLEEFARKNASYHIWPYWREYVTSQSERLRLPRLVLPTVQLANNREESE